MQKEKKMTKKEWRILLFAGICVLGALAFVLVPDYSSAISDTPETIYDEALLSFDKGWYCETTEQDLILPAIVSADQNEEVVLSRKLPDSLTEGTYLRFRSTNAYVSVYINGELIFQNESVSIGGRQTIPLDRWNYIRLQPAYGGKTIKIVFRSPYAYYNGILPEMVLGAHADIILYAFSESALTNYLSICMIAIGLIMILLSLINTMGDSSLHEYAYLGLFLTLIGLVLLSGANLPRNDSVSYYKDYLIMQIGIRLASLVYSLYLFAKMSDRFRNILYSLVLLNIINVFAGIFLHVFGVLDFTQTIWIALVLLAVLFCFELYCNMFSKGCCYSIRYRIVTVIGLSAMILCVSSEIFFRWSYLHRGQKTVVVVGALIFAVFRSIALIFDSSDLASQQIATAKELDDKRIKLMMSQIQPHFIYNTLNTIRSMVKLAPEKAYDMIYCFSNYLKFNINALGDRDLIPFSEELNHIKEYTQIECERFHHLEVVYDIGSESFLIPPLTIQPFVENAIKHGICKKEYGGSVCIKSIKREHFYMICVMDDGVGFDLAILESDQDIQTDGIGIKNSIYRLRELVEAHVEIKSSPGNGCLVTIIIPKVLDEGDMV